MKEGVFFTFEDIKNLTLKWKDFVVFDIKHRDVAVIITGYKYKADTAY